MVVMFQVITRLLPPVSANKLASLFEQHALVRRGKLDGSKEHSVYRGVLEMEELLLRWEEEVKEGKPANEVKELLKKMVGVKIPGWEQFVYLGDPGPSIMTEMEPRVTFTFTSSPSMSTRHPRRLSASAD